MSDNPAPTLVKMIEAITEAAISGIIDAGGTIDYRMQTISPKIALAMLRALHVAGPSDKMVREAFLATNGCCNCQAARDGFQAALAQLIAEIEQGGE